MPPGVVSCTAHKYCVVHQSGPVERGQSSTSHYHATTPTTGGSGTWREEVPGGRVAQASPQERGAEDTRNNNIIALCGMLLLLAVVLGRTHNRRSREPPTPPSTGATSTSNMPTTLTTRNMQEPASDLCSPIPYSSLCGFAYNCIVAFSLNSLIPTMVQ